MHTHTHIPTTHTHTCSIHRYRYTSPPLTHTNSPQYTDHTHHRHISTHTHNPHYSDHNHCRHSITYTDTHTSPPHTHTYTDNPMAHTHTPPSVHRPHSPQTHLHHTHTHTLTCSMHASCIHHVILTSLASQGRQRQILQPPDDTGRMTTNCINMCQLLHDVMSSSSPRRAGRAGGRRSGQDLLGIPLSQLHPICVNVSQREARRLIPVALTSLFSTRAGLRSTSGPLGEAVGGPSLSRGAALMLFPASRPRVEEFQGGPPKSA